MDVRIGLSHALGNPGKRRTGSISPSSAVMPAGFDWSFLTIPEDAAPSRLIDLDVNAPPHRRCLARLGEGNRQPANCYAYRVDGPYEPPRDIASTSTGFFSIPSPPPFRGPAVGFRIGPRIRPFFGGDGLFLSRSGIMPARCQNACFSMSPSIGRETSGGPRHPWSKTVIYEGPCSRLHHSSQDRAWTIPGTYRGLMEKIPYLKALGVTAVELMPVQEFNEHSCDAPESSPNQALKNYWGYDPVQFLRPQSFLQQCGRLGPAENWSSKKWFAPFTGPGSR
jgi:isoamylase